MKDGFISSDPGIIKAQKMLWSSPGLLLRVEHKTVTCSIPLCHRVVGREQLRGSLRRICLETAAQLGSQSSAFPGGVTLACPIASSVLRSLLRSLEVTKVKAACSIVFRVWNSSLKHPVQTLAYVA